jgi:hypothetical protein
MNVSHSFSDVSGSLSSFKQFDAVSGLPCFMEWKSFRRLHVPRSDIERLCREAEFTIDNHNSLISLPDHVHMFRGVVREVKVFAMGKKYGLPVLSPQDAIREAL